MITLKTERLILVGLSPEQLDLALYNPQRLAERLHITLDADVFSEESRQAMKIKLARMSHIEHSLHPWYTYFLIVQAEESQAVGVCGFKGSPNLAGSAEVGYAMHPAYRNRGYMTETVRALVQWAFEQDRCKTVVAETLRDNVASQRVLQKAGMVLDHDSENMLYWRIDKQGSQVVE